MDSRISVVVCAHNEERYLAACLHALLAQTRRADEILVINNASSDSTRAVAEAIPGVRVVDEPRKGLVIARETGRRLTTGPLLAYLDADSRPPLQWLDRLERRFDRDPVLVGISGPFRFYDWDLPSRTLLRVYDHTLAPLTHMVAQRVLGIGAVFYGGGFCVRREALDSIGGFDTSIDFHGEDTNLGRRLTSVGRVALSNACWVYTSARRYKALGRLNVIRLYVRNFWSETIHHRPKDTWHTVVPPSY
jgi:glycosyltransferase involved in cell wall biosynthesis